MVEHILKDIGILVTRPRVQAEKLVNLIQSMGGNPILFPTILIKPLLSPSLETNSFDTLIFTSQNAVIYSQEILRHKIINKPKIIAIGQATKEILDSYGWVVECCPKPPFNSESLLKISALQDCQDKTIGIFCGKNPRDLLMSTLRQRNAKVYAIEVYERILPHINSDEFTALFLDKKIQAIVITSNEGLNNLVTMLISVRQTIKNIPLIVISERGFQLAKELGFNWVFKADNAADEAIISAIVHNVRA